MAGPMQPVVILCDGTDQLAYTSPSAGGGTIISTIALVNDTTSPSTTARVRVLPAGVASTAQDARHTAVPVQNIAPQDVIEIAAPRPIGPGATVRVMGTAGQTVQLYGTEF